jgi:hypothetical protein
MEPDARPRLDTRRKPRVLRSDRRHLATEAPPSIVPRHPLAGPHPDHETAQNAPSRTQGHLLPPPALHSAIPRPTRQRRRRNPILVRPKQPIRQRHHRRLQPAQRPPPRRGQHPHPRTTHRSERAMVHHPHHTTGTRPTTPRRQVAAIAARPPTQPAPPAQDDSVPAGRLERPETPRSARTVRAGRLAG